MFVVKILSTGDYRLCFDDGKSIKLTPSALHRLQGIGVMLFRSVKRNNRRLRGCLAQRESDIIKALALKPRNA